MIVICLLLKCKGLNEIVAFPHILNTVIPTRPVWIDYNKLNILVV